jgi:hypothetical protein
MPAAIPKSWRNAVPGYRAVGCGELTDAIAKIGEKDLRARR